MNKKVWVAGRKKEAKDLRERSGERKMRDDRRLLFNICFFSCSSVVSVTEMKIFLERKDRNYQCKNFISSVAENVRFIFDFKFGNGCLIETI